MKRKLALVLMLVLMLLMLVPFEALAQEIIATGVSDSLKYNEQHKSFYGYDGYWVFLIKSGNLQYTYSPTDDEGNWTTPITVTALSSDVFDLYFDGTYVYIAYGSTIYYQRGLPSTSGTITWGTARNTSLTSAQPTIAVSTTGYVFIGHTSNCDIYCAISSRTTTEIESLGWATASDTNFANAVCYNEVGNRIVALTNGKMAFIWEGTYSSSTTPQRLYAARWTGAAWGASAVAGYTVDFRGTIDAVAQDDDVHVVYLEDVTHDIQYQKYSYSTNSWSAMTLLNDAGSTKANPAITRSTDDNDLHVFYINGDHVYYDYFYSGNSTWYVDYDWITDVDTLSVTLDYNDAIFPTTREHIGLFYQAGPTATILKFKLLDESFVVDTLSASPVGLTFATLRGEIMSLGFGSATERGFLFNTSPTDIGATLEGNETGTFNVGVFTHGITGLLAAHTYWYIAYASGDYGTSYGNWTSFYTSAPVPTPPAGNITGDTAAICNTTVYNFLALPITNTDIKLLWDWYPVSGNSSVQIAIRYKLYSYPGNTTDGTQIYLGTGDAFTHTNLLPGTTYYYRAWLLCGGNYSADYVQDWATTYGSSPVVSPPEQPGGWFQDPSCTAYSKIPLLSNALVAVTTAYGFPATTVCVMFTLLWIIVLGLAVFLFIHSAMMMIITIAVLIILASIMGLLPLWMIVIAICLGGISIYISGRT